MTQLLLMLYILALAMIPVFKKLVAVTQPVISRIIVIAITPATQKRLLARAITLVTKRGQDVPVIQPVI